MTQKRMLKMVDVALADARRAAFAAMNIERGSKDEPYPDDTELLGLREDLRDAQERLEEAENDAEDAQSAIDKRIALLDSVNASAPVMITIGDLDDEEDSKEDRLERLAKEAAEAKRIYRNAVGYARLMGCDVKAVAI